MASNFPNSKDSLTNPSSTTKMNEIPHAEQHTNANDAIEAIENYVGVVGETDTNTITGKLTQIDNKTIYSIEEITNLTDNGFIKTTGDDGTLQIDTNTYLTGNQSITFTSTGDITGSASGATSLTPTLSIGSNKVSNAKLSTVATATFKGRVTAATGNVEDLTGTQATTLLDTFTSALKGLVPASGGGTTNFLRADGTWAAPPGATSGTVTSVSVVSANGLTGSVANSTTTPAITLSTSVTGVLKGNGTAISAAVSGTDYEVPLTFSTGLTRSTNTITVNTTQNIAKLSNLTTNGFLKTTSSDGTLSVDTNTYLTGNQTITLSGDVTGSGTTSIATTVGKINGVSLAGLATGILKNTTTTGIPSIAVAGTDYEVPLTFSTGLTKTTNTITVNTSQNISTLSNLTTNGYVKTSGGTGALSVATGVPLSDINSGTNKQVIYGTGSGVTSNANFTYDSSVNQLAIGTAGTTNLRFGQAIYDGGLTILGRFNESTTDLRFSMGIGPAGDTARILFGHPSLNWQIDNNAGTFRWFTPGTVQMTLTTSQMHLQGNKSIAGVTDLNYSGSIVQTGSNGNTFTADIYHPSSDIYTDTTTGMKINKAPNQKLGFYGSTPIIQPSGNALTALSNLGLISSPTLTKTDVGLSNVDNTSDSTKNSATATLTNKRITRRVLATAGPGATPSYNTDNYDVLHFTALATAITSMTSSASGTPVDGDVLRISFTDNGTARAITWGANFESSGTVTLPTTTVISTRLDCIFVYNTESSKWRIVGIA